MDLKSNVSVGGQSTVSFNGEMMEADKAIDSLSKDLQDGLNQINYHSKILLMGDLRGDSFSEMYPLYHEVEELLKEQIVITKDFIKLAKQLLPPKPRGFNAEECLRKHANFEQ